MATQGQFQATAHTGATDCRDHGFAGSLQQVDHAVDGGLGPSCCCAEFADVGTARERLVGADQDDGTDCSIGFGAFDVSDDACAQGVAQAIDGWVVHADDGDAVFCFVVRVVHDLDGW